ncbi:MAG: response regulator transcription factor [Clostridia bacterium]|nr:response regulator transcription factor [Clostridia bacterium]MBQ2326221.1 response regulator transcription factor [Clostridia bacterium]MBQ5813575.1 response regulator transcription factor [Clostridia bacterium]
MIYIVEDDDNIRQMEAYALKGSGFETMEFVSGSEFFTQCEKQVPKMVLLDIMLPGIDGLTILKKIRETPALTNVGVIMVTAKSTELDAVMALDRGADDYIAKPFGIMELLSRVKALMRRVDNVKTTVYTLGGITLDDERHSVKINEDDCLLTFKEYELLKHLIINRGIVLSRDRIMDVVWGTDYEGGSRTVDMHIKTLRQKLGDEGSHIKTVRNVGYKIE